MKILVFEPNWLGDVIFTTPAFSALKTHFPDCSIGAVVAQRAAPLLRCNPFIDGVITFNERQEDKTLSKKIAFIKTLKAKNYEMVILFHRSLTRTLLCFLAGIKIRAGYAHKKRSLLLTQGLAPIDKDSLHKQDYYLRILEEMGIKVADKSCQVYLPGQDQEWVKEILDKHSAPGDYLIGLNLAANWAPKNWPQEHFEQLMELLQGRIKNIKFFLTAQDRVDDSSILLEDKGRILNLTGKTSLLQLAALYEKMDLVISPDSGPLHLAAAVNTKYLGLYGPTSGKITCPRSQAPGKVIFKNDFCPTPCYVKQCKVNYLCMRTITPQDAVDATLELLTH